MITLPLPFCDGVSDQELHVKCFDRFGFRIIVSASGPASLCVWMINVLVSRRSCLPSAVAVLPLSIHPSIHPYFHSLLHICCWVVICVSYALIPRPTFEYEGLQMVHISHDKALILKFFFSKWKGIVIVDTEQNNFILTLWKTYSVASFRSMVMFSYVSYSLPLLPPFFFHHRQMFPSSKNPPGPVQLCHTKGHLASSNIYQPISPSFSFHLPALLFLSFCF